MNHKAVKSITIHGLDEMLDKLIGEKAAHQGTSLNQTIKILLRQSLGITPDIAKKRQAIFADIFGAWSKADEIAFAKKMKNFERVDRGDWL